MRKVSLKSLKEFADGMGISKTCSVDNPKGNSVMFALTYSHLQKVLENTLSNTSIVLIPEILYGKVMSHNNENVLAFCLDNRKEVFELFVLFHNHVNAGKHVIHKISRKADLHETVLMKNEGLKIVRIDGNLVNMKHIGGSVIDDEVEIGAYTVIHGGVLDPTIIRNGARIGSCCSVGHNAVIGENVILAPHVTVGGSVKIMSSCFVGMGAIIREGVLICDNVRIGMGSLVTKDITMSGLYYGSPAERKGDWDGSW